METLVLQTKNKSQSKALLAFAKALEIKACTAKEIEDRATAKWIMDGLNSRKLSQEESDAFINSLRK
ncbi:MAG: hypothetical protein EAZ27_05635 [Cytophagales bacterium]|nr:MAG: hypothetical protein EAZ38_13510 [Cytophagales bacterium]TAG56163.1 MAG: hypothetical protein EAZ27_05635 [Cytophagales bacterium]